MFPLTQKDSNVSQPSIKEELDSGTIIASKEPSRCRVTGAINSKYADLLVAQAYNAFHHNRCGGKFDNAFYSEATVEALAALNPKDEIEGMLCVRLITLHNESMRRLSAQAGDGSEDNTLYTTNLNISWATKLMRLYNETLEALMRYRRKGEQKVTVQHVNVGEGGQAIVNGQVNQGGGGHDKK